MRQPTTLAAEDQQLLESTFQTKWKEAIQEYGQAITEVRSNQRREALTNARRGITDTFVNADPDNAETKVHAIRRQGITILPVNGGRLTKPGKIGEVSHCA